MYVSLGVTPHKAIRQKPKITNSENGSQFSMNVGITKIKTLVKLARVETEKIFKLSFFTSFQKWLKNALKYPFPSVFLIVNYRSKKV